MVAMYVPRARIRRLALVVLVLAALSLPLAERGWAQPPVRPGMVFILADDQRWDAFGWAGHPFLETPNLDRLAQEGVIFENAFVTTSLCSPSRASLLTGQYAHRHHVLDNRSRLDHDIPTLATVLSGAGYRTAFLGKWHMGDPDDSPRPGFSRWVSFAGQGVYQDPVLNVDGRRELHQGYITDLLTDYAIEFLRAERYHPFLLLIWHKAPHVPFQPAERHRGSYQGRSYPVPESMAVSEENYRGRPDWVRAQRDSWHGVDGMYGNSLTFEQLAVNYAETLRAIDDSTGRILAELRSLNLLEKTVVVYTSDNGFLLGEHGLIDKRAMYEESIRVPLLIRAPALGPGGRRIREMVLNLDLAPTLIELGGAKVPKTAQGRSLAPLLRGEPVAWRDAFLYEYFWESLFPQTPTVFGVRTERHKLVRFHGIWDREELYDLEQDPEERHNLIGEFKLAKGVGDVKTLVLGAPTPELEPLLGAGAQDEELKALYRRLSRRLEELLKETGGAAEPGWSKPGS